MIKKLLVALITALPFVFAATVATPQSTVTTTTAANPTISSTSITGVISPANGGTGVANNSAATITRSGNHALTFTTSNTTNVTLPTTGTLSTIAGSEALTGKTINGNTITSGTGTLTLGAGKTLTVSESATIKVSQGGTVIDSGSLPAAATKSVTIPAGYSYIVIQTTGWSQATNTARIRVRLGTGGTPDSTAGNYVGNVITGTTVTNFTTNALASTTDCATQTTAQTGSATVTVNGIGASSHKTFQARVVAATTECLSMGAFIGTTNAIDVVEFSTSAAGNFDAGTYAVIGY